MFAHAVSLLIHSLVVALMFWAGLDSRRGELLDIWRRRRLYLRALLVVEVAIPLLAIAVVRALGTPHWGTVAILLMAICPGAPMISVFARGKGEAHSSFGLGLLTVLAVLAPVTIPIWITILNRLFPYHFGLAIPHIVVYAATVVLLPIFAGVVVRHFFPGPAVILARSVRTFYLGAMLMAVIVVLVLGGPVLLEVRPITFLAAALVVLGSLVLGWWAGSRDTDPEVRSVTALTVTLGNPGLVLAIVATTYPGFQAPAMVAAYLVFRALVILPFRRRAHRRSARHPPGSPFDAGNRGAHA